MFPGITIVVFIATLLFCETFIYFYHRYIGHESRVLSASHSIHHKRGDLDQGVEDLGWVLLLATVFFLMTIYARLFHLITYSTSLAICIGLILSFAANWNIHRAYHVPGHWLYKYKWFRDLKDNHDQHHRYRRKNYGITNPLFDKIFGTYQPTEPMLQKKI